MRGCTKKRTDRLFKDSTIKYCGAQLIRLGMSEMIISGTRGLLQLLRPFSVSEASTRADFTGTKTSRCYVQLLDNDDLVPRLDKLKPFDMVK